MPAAADRLRATLAIMAGPSGVGKGTVVKRLLELDPTIWLSVSATTRNPRPGEIDGREYVFMSRQDFLKLKASGGLLESAEFAGNLYGTPRAPIDEHLDNGRDVVLEIELQGARQVREAVPEATSVFLAPPSWEELERRLTSRGTEDAQALRRRLARAKTELAAQDEFDVVIINTDVDSAARQLVAWIRSCRSQA